MYTIPRRTVRKLKQYMGCMRCSWCGKWTQILGPKGEPWSTQPFDKWVKFNNKHGEWYCRRPKCLKAREDCGGPV